MSEYIFSQCSSLEKIFLNTASVDDSFNTASVLKGEELSYQIAHKYKNRTADHVTKSELLITINSPVADIATIYSVGNVPSELPAYPDNCDEGYITTSPGFFPDVLYPIEGNKIESFNNAYRAIWISVRTTSETKAGKFPIEIVFSEKDGAVVGKKTLTLEVIDAALPEQKLIFTQWFHADCISTFYNVDTFGEEHWGLIDSYMKMATAHGINMLLTPVFTPPLDTEVGGERPTVQLVDVEVNNGEYTFNFDKLLRWIDMGLKNNVRYFEISHLFTQWGALSTPKIEALVDGKKEKLFGWHTKSDSEEYNRFLSCLLPALIKVLREKGIADNTYFHISDEPHLKDLESYKKAKDSARELLRDFKIIDALSDFEFYKKGVVENPIPGLDAVDTFIQNGVSDLWTYNCCAQCNQNLSNRFMAMPSYRNRIIGCQLYKHNIKGFLHWGYNFYYTRYSKKYINPFLVTDAGGSFPSGDAFSVYPDKSGPIPSIRLKVFNEALQDMRAMQLLERYMSKKEIIALIDEISPVTFRSYPNTPDYILALREKINNKIKEFI